jgi:hypothetical protein
MLLLFLIVSINSHVNGIIGCFMLMKRTLRCSPNGIIGSSTTAATRTGMWGTNVGFPQKKEMINNVMIIKKLV